MKTFSPWFLATVLAAGLGMIYLLPSAGKVADSAVSMELPRQMSQWDFRSRAPSEEEVGALEKGTRFSKADCYRPRPGEFTAQGYVPDVIDLSIVLSGTDLNNSIHRPERCMPAQGHVIRSSASLELPAEKGGTYPVKRLQSIRILRDADQKAAGELHAITYYFFVGHDRITNDHLERTIIDMKDRLLRGMDQRWAYVSVSTYFGKLPWLNGKEVTEEEADQTLRDFTVQLSNDLINWEQVHLD